MAGFEQLMIVGNLGRDPKLSYTQSGVPFCTFSVAVNRVTGRGDERTETVKWFSVTAWRDDAERCNQYLRKGGQVLVIGTVEAAPYEDQAGKPAASLNLSAQMVRFMSGKEDGAPAQAGAAAGSHEESPIDIPF